MQKIQILFLFIFILFAYQNCGQESKEKARIGITMPKQLPANKITHASPHADKKLAAPGDNQAFADIWISNNEPLATSDLNCFGVIVNADDVTNDSSGAPIVRSENRCVSNTGQEFSFVEKRMGALPGETINVEIEAGSDREIVILGWKAGSQNSCKSLRGGNAVNVANLSHPFVIGKVRTDVTPGDQTISIDASFTGATRLLGCKHFKSDGSVAAAPTPPPQNFNISGTVTGLDAEQTFTLKNNGGDEIIITDNGPFTFPTQLAPGSTYNVSVAQLPSGGSQGCLIENGTGEVGDSNINNIQVTCNSDGFLIGGEAEGLRGPVGKPIILNLATSDEEIGTIEDIEIFRNGFSNDCPEGEFVELAQNEVGADRQGNICEQQELPRLLNGTSFTWNIVKQPSAHSCILVNPTGIINGEDNFDARVVCTPNANTVQINGTVSGLDDEESESITIVKFFSEGFIGEGEGGEFPLIFDESTETIQVGNGEFTFNGILEDGETVSFLLADHPEGKICFMEQESVTAVAAEGDIDIEIVCEPFVFDVDVSVTGIFDGAEIRVENTVTGDFLFVDTNGFHNITDDALFGDEYDIAVTVTTQPFGGEGGADLMECSVEHGNGNAGQDTDIPLITCEPFFGE